MNSPTGCCFVCGCVLDSVSTWEILAFVPDDVSWSYRRFGRKNKFSYVWGQTRYDVVFLCRRVQLSPPPDPIPHRVPSSPFPILCLQAGQEAARAVLAGRVAHMCWLPRTGPRAGISADSVLSLALSRDMNWGLCPTQSKVGLPIL